MNVIDQWLELTGIKLKITSGSQNSRATVALPDHTPGKRTSLKFLAQDGKKKTQKVIVVAPVTDESVEKATEKLFLSMRGLHVETAKGNFNTPWTLI